MVKILLVEDDYELSDSIKEILIEIGEVTQVYDGELGLFEAESTIYDLLVLDIMLPGKNGFEILSALKQKKSALPVLVVSAKDELPNKIEGFQKGADDYLTKPFYREELLMRVKALLKRSIGLFDDATLQYGEVICNLHANSVSFREEKIPLQGKEFDLLVYFIQNAGTILTKEQIFDRIWGYNSETTLTVVEVYVSHLRKHLKGTDLENKIKTLRHVGYLLQEQSHE